MFDRKRGISGERPEHIDFIKNKAKPLFESWGYIGLETLKRVAKHSAFANLPFILETQNDHDGYKKEIEMLKS